MVMVTAMRDAFFFRSARQPIPSNSFEPCVFNCPRPLSEKKSPLGESAPASFLPPLTSEGSSAEAYPSHTIALFPFQSPHFFFVWDNVRAALYRLSFRCLVFLKSMETKCGILGGVLFFFFLVFCAVWWGWCVLNNPSRVSLAVSWVYGVYQCGPPSKRRLPPVSVTPTSRPSMNQLIDLLFPLFSGVPSPLLLGVTLPWHELVVRRTRLLTSHSTREDERYRVTWALLGRWPFVFPRLFVQVSLAAWNK